MKRFFALLIITSLIGGGGIYFYEKYNIAIDNPPVSGEIYGEQINQIIWWGLFEDSNNIDGLISEFKINNPSIDVVYTQKSKETYEDELKTNLQDGNPNNTPDIFMVHNTWVEAYSDLALSAPDSIFSAQEFEDRMHKFVSDDFLINGKVYAVPLWVDLLGLVYNKSYLTATGDTVIANQWNNFQTQASNMTTRDSQQVVVAGFSAGSLTNTEFATEVLDLLFLQARSFPLSEESKLLPFVPGEATKAQDAITFYKSFLSEPSTWNSSSKLDTALFVEGKLASVIVPTWRLHDIEVFNSTWNLGLDLGTAKVPQLNTTPDNQRTLATYWGYMVSSDSNNSNESWKFLKYLTEKSTQESYATSQISNGRKFVMLSPRKDLLPTKGGNLLLDPYIDSIASVVSWRHPNGSKVKVQYENILKGETNPEELLATISDMRENKSL